LVWYRIEKKTTGGKEGGVGALKRGGQWGEKKSFIQMRSEALPGGGYQRKEQEAGVLGRTGAMDLGRRSGIRIHTLKPSSAG